MNKIEHIGIAVKSLEEAIPRYEQLLKKKVESEQVNTAFFRVGESKIELLESADPTGVIAKFIEKRGEGLHHTAYDVSNIEAEMSRLKEAGFVLLNETPKKGADNKWVCFVHPKNTNGVLIELCQEIR